MNFFKVGLEFVAFHGEDGACPHVTGIIVAIVNKAFSADVPAGAHAGVFVPLGTIPCAFYCKIVLQTLPSFMGKSLIGVEFLTTRTLLTSSDFLFFSPVHFLSSPGKTVAVVVGFLGGGIIKLGGRIMSGDPLRTISKTSSKQARRSLTIKRSSNFRHSPS